MCKYIEMFRNCGIRGMKGLLKSQNLILSWNLVHMPIWHVDLSGLLMHLSQLKVLGEGNTLSHIRISCGTSMEIIN